MPLTPEAKKLLAETIRGTAQDPEKGLRARLLRAIHDEADRRYRLAVPIAEAGLDEAHRKRRERIAAWVSAAVTTDDDRKTLGGYIHTLTGMDEAWEAAYPVEQQAAPFDRLLRCLGGWVLSVEYVRDLRRPPQREMVKRLVDLSAPLAKACGELVASLPAYRLTKFQDCLPERFALEVVEGFMLDVGGAVRWLGGEAV